MRLVEDDYTGPRAATLGCPAPDVLMALNGEGLPEELRQRAEVHVASCSACKALVADLNAIDVEVPESLDARVLTPATAAGGTWRTPLLALAAVLVAAVALGVFYRNSQTSSDDRVARVQTSAATPAPAAPQAGTWDVKKPALLLPLATALVVRGADEEASRALGAALAPYRTDDYVAAERLLEGVVQKYPSSADAWFYLGSTRLLDGDPAGAREALNEARTRGVGDRDDEAAWLLATAEARTGALDQARRRLTALCAGAGAFKTAACNARTALR
jgi:tetratricopeptide (TPR) repeat protein